MHFYKIRIPYYNYNKRTQAETFLKTCFENGDFGQLHEIVIFDVY